MKLIKDKVKLFVRLRPTSSLNPANVRFIGDKIIEIRRAGLKTLTLVTDGIFTNNVQAEVHHNIGKLGIVKNLMDGYSTTFLTYGIDNVAKSFTLFGSANNYTQRGLIPRFISDIYEEVRKIPSDKVVTVKVSAINVCGDNIYDLLSPEGLSLQRKCTVNNFLSHVAVGEENALCLYFLAKKNKKNILKMQFKNSQGEWAHFVFQITVEIRSLTQSDTKILASKLKFVELAGAVGQLIEPITKEQLIARETISILEHDLIDKRNCPRTDKPCRRCKLSYLLKDVICGKALCVVILGIRTEPEYFKSLTHTIMFGQRLLEVELKADQTAMPDAHIIRETMQQDLDSLKLELYRRDILANRKPIDYTSLNDSQKKQLHVDIQDFLNGKNEKIQVYTQAELQNAFDMIRSIHRNIQHQNEIRLELEREILRPTLSLTKQELEIESPPAVPLPKKDRQTDLLSINYSRMILPEEETVEPSFSVTALVAPVEEEVVVYEETLTEDFETESELPAPRLEAFEEFKLRPGKHLNESFLAHKALTQQKKIEFNRRLHDLQEKKAALLKLVQHYNELYTAIRDPSTSEVLIDIKDKLEIGKQQCNEGTTQCITALGEVRASQKIGYQLRRNFLQAFDTWYEKKLTAVRYQAMLKSKEYQTQGPAMQPKLSHRKCYEAVGAMTRSEAKFEAAKSRVSDWLKHTGNGTKQCQVIACSAMQLSFDFLSHDDSD